MDTTPRPVPGPMKPPVYRHRPPGPVTSGPGSKSDAVRSPPVQRVTLPDLLRDLESGRVSSIDYRTRPDA